MESTEYNSQHGTELIENKSRERNGQRGRGKGRGRGRGYRFRRGNKPRNHDGNPDASSWDSGREGTAQASSNLQPAAPAFVATAQVLHVDTAAETNPTPSPASKVAEPPTSPPQVPKAAPTTMEDHLLVGTVLLPVPLTYKDEIARGIALRTATTISNSRPPPLIINPVPNPHKVASGPNTAMVPGTPYLFRKTGKFDMRQSLTIPTTPTTNPYNTPFDTPPNAAPKSPNGDLDAASSVPLAPPLAMDSAQARAIIRDIGLNYYDRLETVNATRSDELERIGKRFSRAKFYEAKHDEESLALHNVAISKLEEAFSIVVSDGDKLKEKERLQRDAVAHMKRSMMEAANATRCRRKVEEARDEMAALQTAQFDMVVAVFNKVAASLRAMVTDQSPKGGDKDGEKVDGVKDGDGGDEDGN